MYYILDCPLLICKEDSGVFVEAHTPPKLAGVRRWWSGLPIKEKNRAKMPNPVEIPFDIYRGYEGPPPEMDDLRAPFMSKRLQQSLLAAGVDNIEFFPAVLKKNQSSERYDYFVFNVVGKVVAADLTQLGFSTFFEESASGDTSFARLVIDETIVSDSKTPLLFRLAEDVSAIVIHQSVKNKIEEAGIDTLQFVRPENYLRL